MRYWVGATSCQMQFLLGGYSLGHPGLVMEPLSLVRKPPQAAAGRDHPAPVTSTGLGTPQGARGGGFGGTLTLAATLVRCQLVARVTGTLVAAQGVDAALLAATVVGAGALVHLCTGQGSEHPTGAVPTPSTPPERPPNL